MLSHAIAYYAPPLIAFAVYAVLAGIMYRRDLRHRRVIDALRSTMRSQAAIIAAMQSHVDRAAKQARPQPMPPPRRYACGDGMCGAEDCQKCHPVTRYGVKGEG